ncbi:MAG: hypothetical protein Q4E57_11060, partial [Eubacteriales bacterium]|nr:hypothetical protein [Eubacteriales bacterium]
YASVKYEYDFFGNCVREFYYDEKGLPAKQIDGIYGQLREYKLLGYGRLDSITYLGENGEPAPRTSDGYATVTYKYDLKGNIIGERYFDVSGAPFAQPSGQYGCNREFDSKKQVTSLTYVDVEGNPIMITSGFATVRYIGYDDNKVSLGERYYDEQGNPVALAKGQYGFDSENNDLKQMVSQTFVDANGNPMMITDGYSTIKRAYDDAGNVTEEYYYDTDMKPVTSVNGYYGIIRTYDSDKKVISQKYVLEDGYKVEEVVVKLPNLSRLQLA